MIKDHYAGIPKKVPVLVDELGDTHTATKNKVGYMVTGSGSLSDGYLAVVDANVGYHTMVTALPESGTGAIAYELDVVNTTVKFSSAGSDGRFSYCLFNPGIGGIRK